MTNSQLFFLLVGLLFFTIGFLASKHHKWKKAKTYLLLILGLFIIFTSTFGPLSKSSKRINEIRNIDSNSVERIIFQPISNNMYESLFEKDSIVTERNTIHNICSLLHMSKEADAGFLKNAKKASRVEIHFFDHKVIALGVKKSGTKACVELYSEGTFGWHYGNLEANAFGTLFDTEVQ